MTDVNTTNRPLAGGTKQYLDDLFTLNAGVTSEIQRGVREGYLDHEGAVALAAKLGVEPPRVKKTFRMYFERTSVYVMNIEAYDEDEAEVEATRLMTYNIDRSNGLAYGAQTRFRDKVPGSNGPRHRFSVISRQRPEVHVPTAVHPATTQAGVRLAELRQRREQAAQPEHTENTERFF